MTDISGFGPQSSYRLYEAGTPTRRVGRELAADFVQRIMIRRRHGDRILWYVRRVDDALIEQLLAGIGDLMSVLNLHEWQANDVQMIRASTRGTPLGGDSPSAPVRGDRPAEDRAVVLVDRDNNPVGVTVPGSLPPTTATLFPRVGSDARKGVEPDQVVRFTVELAATPTHGAGGLVVADFADGEVEIELQAVASSADFLPVRGETWVGSFKVDRAMRSRPASWEFHARAVGDRPVYMMAIGFVARGRSAGGAFVALGRKGLYTASSAVCAEPFAVPSPVADGITLRITRSAGEWRVLMLRDGIQVGEPAPWTIDADADYLRAIEDAKDYTAIQEAGYSLWVDLPPAVTSFLQETRGIATHIESNTPVAPFEALRLDPRGSGPLLGEDRVVTRWIPDAGVPRPAVIAVKHAACIRPSYPTKDALPSAEAEEAWLHQELPDLVRVAKLQELDALLDRSDVSAVHFAGHADGVPPRLVLEANENVLPSRFAPNRPLLAGHPFFFINGCRAAIGRHATPAAQGNMARTLLRGAQCAALIAPLVKVDSPTALEVTKTFYTQVAAGRTVGEAMQAMRRLAQTSGPATHAGSYLSYLVYASPELRLRFG